MTVETQICEDSYVADGSASLRSIGFPILTPAYLAVYVDGDIQTLGADYTISGDYIAGQGRFTPVVAWPAGSTVFYQRRTAAVQPALLPPGQPLPSRSIEQQLDRVVMLDQEKAARLARTPERPIHGDYTNFVPIIMPDGGWGLTAVSNANVLVSPYDLPDAVADQTDWLLPQEMSIKPVVELNGIPLDGSDVTLLDSLHIRLNLDRPLRGGEKIRLVPFEKTDVPQVALDRVFGLAEQLARFAPVEAGLPIGAVGDGVTNDSALFQSLLGTQANLRARPNVGYALRDVALTHGRSIEGGRYNALAGGVNLFRLDGFNPRVSKAYLANSDALTGPAFRLLESRGAIIDSVMSVNGKNGLIDLTPANPATQSCTRTTLSNVRHEGLETTGINIGSSSNDHMFSNVEIFGKSVAGAGGYKPHPSSIGWRQNTPVVGDRAVGGHLVNQLVLINLHRGMHLTDAQLSKYSNSIIDGCADYGLLIDGASQYIDFDGLFVGTTRGIRIGGTSIVSFTGLRGIFAGHIPPGAGSDFFDNVSTFYDMEVLDSARVTISGRFGGFKVFVAPTAKLIVDGGHLLRYRSIGAIGAGAMTYLGDCGQQAIYQDAAVRAPYDCYLIRMTGWCDTAPGAGQTVTYDALVDNQPVSLNETISGAASFGGTDRWVANHVFVPKGVPIAPLITTTGGTAAARHQVHMQLVPAGG